MSTREYAKNLFSKWSDEEWLDQPRFDKLFWECLNGQRSVNLIGVFPLNFTRWRKAMRDGPTLATEVEVKTALIHLQRRRAVFVDENTGEALIRTRIRNDELDKQPNVLLSALRMLAVVDSPIFATVLLGEMDRISLPVIDKTTPAATRLRDNLKRAWDDARTHLEALADGTTEPFPEPFAEDFPEGLPRPGKTESAENPSRNPSVSVSGSVSVSPSPSVGTYVGDSHARPDDAIAQPPHCADCHAPLHTGADGRPHPSGKCPDCRRKPTDAGDDPEPPTRCKAHATLPADAEVPNCPHCGTFTQAHARWQIRERRRQAQATSDAAQARATVKADAIANCTLCGPDGYVDGATTPCTHDPAQAATNAKGSAAVRAALAQAQAAKHQTDADTAEPEQATTHA